VREACSMRTHCAGDAPDNQRQWKRPSRFVSAMEQALCAGRHTVCPQPRSTPRLQPPTPAKSAHRPMAALVPVLPATGETRTGGPRWQTLRNFTLGNKSQETSHKDQNRRAVQTEKFCLLRPAGGDSPFGSVPGHHHGCSKGPAKIAARIPRIKMLPSSHPRDIADPGL